MSHGFVIFEWNQAGGRPTLQPELFEDGIEEAVQSAKDLIASSREAGRREQYTVHEVSDPVWLEYEDEEALEPPDGAP